MTKLVGEVPGELLLFRVRSLALAMADPRSSGPAEHDVRLASFSALRKIASGREIAVFIPLA
ncbi:hypothetical protein HY251_06270 [bacterium]|nr:hypothetical protein [bacterium]